jgi:hypothetical protein
LAGKIILTVATSLRLVLSEYWAGGYWLVMTGGYWLVMTGILRGCCIVTVGAA